MLSDAERSYHSDEPFSHATNKLNHSSRRAVWEIHSCNDSIRALGLCPRALINHCTHVFPIQPLELWFKYRIDHCIAGCMTHYLPREKLSPAEANEVPRAKPKVLPRLPREITFPKVDNGSYNPLRSDLSILYCA